VVSDPLEQVGIHASADDAAQLFLTNCPCN